MKKGIFLFFLMAIIASSCTTTHYYLVRHAERLDNSSDSPLSDIGHSRANALREALITKGIDTLLASTRIRTQQTAQPLATALGKALTIYSPDTTAGLIQRLQQIKRKQVLVVGHSNTIPEIVKGLSGQAVQIADNDFDNLFIVTRRRFCWGRTTSKLGQTVYGATSP